LCIQFTFENDNLQQKNQGAESSGFFGFSFKNFEKKNSEKFPKKKVNFFFPSKFNEKFNIFFSKFLGDFDVGKSFLEILTEL